MASLKDLGALATFFQAIEPGRWDLILKLTDESGNVKRRPYTSIAEAVSDPSVTPRDMQSLAPGSEDDAYSHTATRMPRAPREGSAYEAYDTKKYGIAEAAEERRKAENERHGW